MYCKEYPDREHLRNYCDSVKGYIAEGRVTTIKCTNSNRVLCKHIELYDIEVHPNSTTIYKVGPTVEHAYIDKNLIVETEGSFIAYVQVTRYERFDKTVSYGFASLPEILELELKLKVAISCALKPSNRAKRQENYFNLTFLMNEFAVTGNANQATKSIDRLSNLKVDIDLLDLAMYTVRQLSSSLKPKKKKKKKGFGSV